jgi:hypothetical protein
MARAMVPSQQKLAEKLTILHDRGVGMLIRIYNIKKVLLTICFLKYFQYNSVIFMQITCL